MTYYEVCAESIVYGEYPKAFSKIKQAEAYFENRVEQAEDDGGNLEITLNEVVEYYDGKCECSTLKKAIIELDDGKWVARRIEC